MDCNFIYSLGRVQHRTLTTILVFLLILLWAGPIYAQMMTTVPPKAQAIMKNPETKKIDGEETYIVTTQRSEGWLVVISVFRTSDRPALKYSDIRVRVYDEAGSELSAEQSIPEEKVFSGRGLVSGYYNVKALSSSRIATVALTLGRETKQFHITSDAISKPASFPVLKGQQTSVSLYRQGGRLGLIVTIFKTVDTPPVLYSEMGVKAYDDSGEEIPTVPLHPKQQTFGGPLQCSGEYSLTLKRPDQRVAKVILSRGEDKATFFPARTADQGPR